MNEKILKNGLLALARGVWALIFSFVLFELTLISLLSMYIPIGLILVIIVLSIAILLLGIFNIAFFVGKMMKLNQDDQ